MSIPYQEQQINELETILNSTNNLLKIEIQTTKNLRTKIANQNSKIIELEKIVNAQSEIVNDLTL